MYIHMRYVHLLYDNREADVAHPALDALNIEAHFNGFANWGVSENKIVLISDTVEESFYAVGEWSEYIAAFFNQEAKVTGLADMALKRCVYTGRNALVNEYCGACKYAYVCV